MVTWLDYCSQRARRFPSSSFSRKLAKQLQEGGIITGGWSEPREVSASGRKGEAVRLGFGVHARDVAERRLEDACIREGGAYGVRKTVVSEWRFDQTSSTKGEDVRPEGGQADDVCQDVVVGSYSVEGQGGCQGENQKCTSSHDDELNLLLTKRKQDKNKKNKKKKRLIGGSWNVLVLLEMTNYLTYADAAAHTNLTFLLREVLGRCLSLSLRRLQLPQLCDAHGNVPAHSLSLSLSFSVLSSPHPYPCLCSYSFIGSFKLL